MLTIDEALAIVRERVRPGTVVDVPLKDALGLVLAEEARNATDSPPFDKAMMDGFAVRAEDMDPTGTQLRIVDEIMAGQTPNRPVGRGEASRIMTGAPMPEQADAVVPVEWTTTAGQIVSIEPRTVKPGQNILRRATVSQAGDLLVPAGRRLRPQELGSLAEGGHAVVKVRPRPVVAIISTGDELIPVEQTPGPGQIRNSNELMLTAQVDAAGATSRPLGIARDEAAHLQSMIQQGLTSDVLILSGGVSAGQLDLVPGELARAGVEPVFHKIQLRPGKPLWFGVRPPGDDVPNPCYVFGLPGNPVSSMVCFELFVRAALRLLTGEEPAQREPLRATLTAPAENRTDRPTMHPARYEVRDGRAEVRLIDWKGSADLHALVNANALVSLPPGPATIDAGETVDLFVLSGSEG